MLTPETFEELEQVATKELKVAQDLAKKLQQIFGETIPVSQNIEVSAANVAYMNNSIEEYSLAKLALLKMKDAKSVDLGNGLIVRDEGMMNMYRLGIVTALEVILNPNIETVN